MAEKSDLMSVLVSQLRPRYGNLAAPNRVRFGDLTKDEQLELLVKHFDGVYADFTTGWIPVQSELRAHYDASSHAVGSKVYTFYSDFHFFTRGRGEKNNLIGKTVALWTPVISLTSEPIFRDLVYECKKTSEKTTDIEVAGGWDESELIIRGNMIHLFLGLTHGRRLISDSIFMVESTFDGGYTPVRCECEVYRAEYTYLSFERLVGQFGQDHPAAFVDLIRMLSDLVSRHCENLKEYYDHLLVKAERLGVLTKSIK